MLLTGLRKEVAFALYWPFLAPPFYLFLIYYEAQFSCAFEKKKVFVKHYLMGATSRVVAVRVKSRHSFVEQMRMCNESLAKHDEARINWKTQVT
jgi:hypothetical protein